MKIDHLARKIASDKILCEKASNIAKTRKYNGYQKGLALMIYKFFDKTSTLLVVRDLTYAR